MSIFQKKQISEELKIVEPTEDFVLNDLHDHIVKHTRLTYNLRDAAVIFKISVILLSTISTILLGLSIKRQEYIEWSRNIAFVIGATVTLISSIFAAFDIERYWLKSKLQLFRLLELQNEYMFLRGRKNGITEEEIQNIYYRHREITRMKYDYWEQVIKKQDEKTIEIKEGEENKPTTK